MQQRFHRFVQFPALSVVLSYIWSMSGPAVFLLVLNCMLKKFVCCILGLPPFSVVVSIFSYCCSLSCIITAQTPSQSENRLMSLQPVEF